MFDIDTEQLINKFVGALLGTAVGDALGMPMEGLQHKNIIKSHGPVNQMLEGFLPKGHYTDDTQMMIGIAESLIECKGFDGEHMMNKFIENFQAFRGYGPGAVQVMQRIIYGQRWNEAALHIYGGGSYGNGAAMRIAPVGVLYHRKPELLIEAAEQTSRLTHAHFLGVEGGLLQAYAVGLATATSTTLSELLDKKEFLTRIKDIAEQDYFITKLEKIISFLEQEDNPDEERVIAELGAGVQAHNSVPIAIYCFLKKSESFRDAVSYAVSMGGDADTIGAMTGALSGALHGASAIPEDWKNDLENKRKGREYIIQLGEQLFELFQKS